MDQEDCISLYCTRSAIPGERLCQVHLCFACSESNTHRFEGMFGEECIFYSPTKGKCGGKQCGNLKIAVKPSQYSFGKTSLWCLYHTCAERECSGLITSSVPGSIWCKYHVCGYQGCLLSVSGCLEHYGKRESDWSRFLSLHN